MAATNFVAHDPCLCRNFGALELPMQFAACLLISEWAARRKEPKDTSPGSLYGANMCQAIDTALNGHLLAVDSSGYGIGFDFCQIFNFRAHSSGVMFLR